MLHHLEWLYKKAKEVININNHIVPTDDVPPLEVLMDNLIYISHHVLAYLEKLLTTFIIYNA